MALGVLIVLLNIATSNYSATHSDSAVEVIYFVLAAACLAFVEVRLERGRLTLSGLANGPAAALLNPLNATLVGLATGFAMVRRPAWSVVGNAVTSAGMAATGAVVGSLLHSAEGSLVTRLAAVLVAYGSSLVFVAVGMSLRTRESIPSIARRNFTQPLLLAYGYFTLAALLTTYLVDGSVLGYILATIVFVLALALTDTIAGRRVRQVLESELTDADRHLFHSRAVEGVVHNLRNHIATAVGYLKEIDLNRLDAVDRDAVETAKAAANDAVTVLQSLAHGATPRVTYAAEPVDLNELVSRALDMARPRARAKHIELGLHEAPDGVTVRADPLLLREVATNLVNNAIDAAPLNGKVELGAGRRSNGWPYFSVSDNGPGVADENRHHLFEPHFTTKESGTGLGLFMSYGIVREHQGQLLFEGNRHGAVFTVVLPPFERFVSRG
jgi:signal transduction histidine kinase